MDLQAIHDFLYVLALRAGDMITAARPSAADTKKNCRYRVEMALIAASDLVTETDKAVEVMISDALRAEYPSYSFLGEESATSGSLSSAPTFIVDPIDGTANFFHGHPYVSVSLCFAHNQQALVGIVYNPFLQHLYHAIAGKGAYLTAPSLPTSHPPLPQSTGTPVMSVYSTTRLPLRERGALEGLSKCLVAVEWGNERSGSHWDIKTSAFEALAGDETIATAGSSKTGRMVHSLRSLGSAALNCCAVARGDLDAYWEGGCWAWDIAAGWVIVQEAGGVVAGGNGGEWSPMIDDRRYLVVRGASGGQKELVEEFWSALSGDFSY